MRALLLAALFVFAAASVSAQVVRCPDGSTVAGPSCQRCPDGRWISSSQQCYRTPGGWVGVEKPERPKYEWERERDAARDWDTNNPWNPKRP